MAFPTTSLLDAFNRADENPVNTNWGDVHPAVSEMRIVSNQLVGQVAGSFNCSHWETSFGADQEAWATLAAKWSSNNHQADLWVRTQNPPGGDLDSYSLKVYDDGADEIITLWRQINTGDTLIGSVVATITAGDGLGISAIGTTIRAYHKIGAGAWTEVLNVTDSVITGTGYLAVGASPAGTIVWDNFGGGTFVPEEGSAADNAPIPILGWGAA